MTAATHVDGTIQKPANGCTACHGVLAGQAGAAVANTSATSAPGFNATAVDASGSALTTSRGVGAHLRHLTPTLRTAGLSCTECHGPIPAANDTLHANGTVAVAWGTLASTNGSVPTTSVAGSTLSCSATWCHGGNAALSGATAATIAWNANATVNCTSCHGNPPAGNGHPANTACATCHGTGYTWLTATTGSITGAALTTHIDGAITLLASSGCASCHGDAARVAVAGADGNVPAAPPAVASATGVAGVHLAHVNQGATAPALSSPLACSNCHTVPGSTSHSDGAIGVTYAGISVAQGAVPTAYNNAAHTCSNTYCHGNFPGGNQSATAISWSTSGKLGCTACHGNPPAISTHHPANTNCVACHTGYSNTTVTAATHVDGTIQKPANGCTACHGVLAGQAGAAVANTSATSAPGFTATAVDASGSALTTSRGVGAHLRHLTPTLRSAGLSCTECHGPIPAANDTLHANGTVAVAWGTLATTRSSVPTTSVAGPTLSCSATWCHGGNAALSGATAATIAWNANATVNCTSCHGNPPAGLGHPANTACATCHGTGYTWLTATTGSITLGALATHIDGTINLTAAQSCSSCHGTTGRVSVAGADVNQAASPPAVASATGVAGVHLAHVNQGATAPALSNALACVNCHTVPTVNAHSDGAIGVTYASISVAQGAVPTAYNNTAHTCSNTYCHGNFPGGNQSATAISWSTAGKLGCTACHGNPPAISTHHPANTNCVACHTGYSNTTVTAATHVDGTIQKPANGCTACHGVLAGQAGAAVANTSATSAPGFTATAVDASGSALTTSRGVGAHLRHLTPTLRSAGLSCTECHGPIPAANDTLHANGTVAVAWGTLATTRSSVPTTSVAGPTLSCSATWCHGGNAALSGATAATIAWNANATVNCTSCHGNPPTGLGHPANTACATCHGTGYTWLTATTGSITLGALATHIDGTINLTAAQSCSSCHGTTGRVSVAGADVNQAASPPAVAIGHRRRRRAPGAREPGCDGACAVERARLRELPHGSDGERALGRSHRRDLREHLGRAGRGADGVQQRRAHLLEHLLPRQLPGRQPERDGHLLVDRGQARLHGLPRQPAGHLDPPPGQHELRRLPHRLQQHDRRRRRPTSTGRSRSRPTAARPATACSPARPARRSPTPAPPPPPASTPRRSTPRVARSPPPAAWARTCAT